MTRINTNANAGMHTSRPDTVETSAEPSIGELRKASDGYYLTVNIQKSVAHGVSREKVDGPLAEVIAKAMESGGRIGIQEAHQILAKITDGKAYGAGEKALTRMILSACDDRRAVLLQGVKVRITEPAENVLKRELPKFWGSL